VKLRDVIDLHVTIDAILGFVVFANPEARVEDECIKAVKFAGKLARYSIDTVEVLEFDLDRVNSRHIAELLQAFLSLGKVLFLLSQKIQRAGVVLEDVCTDAESDTC